MSQIRTPVFFILLFRNISYLGCWVNWSSCVEFGWNFDSLFLFLTNHFISKEVRGTTKLCVAYMGVCMGLARYRRTEGDSATGASLGELLVVGKVTPPRRQLAAHNFHGDKFAHLPPHVTQYSAFTLKSGGICDISIGFRIVQVGA